MVLMASIYLALVVRIAYFELLFPRWGSSVLGSVRLLLMATFLGWELGRGLNFPLPCFSGLFSNWQNNGRGQASLGPGSWALGGKLWWSALWGLTVCVSFMEEAWVAVVKPTCKCQCYNTQLHWKLSFIFILCFWILFDKWSLISLRSLPSILGITYRLFFFFPFYMFWSHYCILRLNCMLLLWFTIGWMNF